MKTIKCYYEFYINFKKCISSLFLDRKIKIRFSEILTSERRDVGGVKYAH